MEGFKKFIKDLLEIIIVAAIITFLLLRFVLMPVIVSGSSMLPGLKENDFGFSFIISRNIELKRFDRVVVDNGEKLIVKRLIGLPNEVVEYKDNVLYVNGKKYEEEYLKDVTTEDLKIVLKADEYYCLGDNRNVSRDSRAVGPFSYEQIKASHVFVLFPFSEFGYKK